MSFRVFQGLQMSFIMLSVCQYCKACRWCEKRINTLRMASLVETTMTMMAILRAVPSLPLTCQWWFNETINFWWWWWWNWWQWIWWRWGWGWWWMSPLSGWEWWCSRSAIKQSISDQPFTLIPTHYMWNRRLSTKAPEIKDGKYCYTVEKFLLCMN